MDHLPRDVHAHLGDSRPATEPLTVTVNHNAPGLHAIVVGEIDTVSLNVIDHELADQPTDGTIALVVDLSRVPFRSVGGALWLVSLLERANEATVPLEVVVDVRAVRRVVRSLALAERFSGHGDRMPAQDRLG